MADRIKPRKGLVFIPLETWEKPNGVNRATAHVLSAAEAMRIAQAEAETNFDIPIRLRELYSNYPNLSPDIASSFAQFGITSDNPAAALAAKYDSLSKQVQGFDGMKGANPAAIQQALQAIGSDAPKADIKDHNDARWFSGFKGFTRTATAMLFAPLQALTQYTRIYARNITQATEGKRDWATALLPTTALVNKSLYENTILYQMTAADKESGQGYFPGYKSAAVQASEDIAKDTLTIKGTNDMAWTLGRQIGDIFFDPEDTAFKTLSGIVDGAIAITADPLIVGTRLKASNTVKKVANAGVAAAKSARTAIADAEYATRQAKRIEQAKILMQESDDAIVKMKDSIIQDLITTHESSILGKGTTSVEDAVAIGKKYDVTKLQKEYDDAINQYNKINNLLKSEKPLEAAKAAGVKFSAKLDTEEKMMKSLKSMRSRAKTKQNAAYENIQSAMGEVYATDLAPQMALLEEAKVKYLNDTAFAKRLTEQSKNTDEARKIVEAHRAGLKVTPEDAKIERSKAIEWLAGPRPQFFMQAIADADNAAAINRISGGRFGAELSNDLAMAKTVQDVEDVLLPLIGVKIDTLMPTGSLQRYVASRYPIFKMRVANSERLDGIFNKLNSVFDNPFKKMPNGRYIHFEDTEGLATQVTRWMGSVGYKQPEIDAAFNRIAGSDSKNISERRNIVMNIINEVLDKTAADAGLSATSRSAITEALTAYKQNTINEGLYHSRQRGFTSGFKILLGRGEEINLDGIPNSHAQLAYGIRLPDVMEIRRHNGRVARAARSLDRMVGKGEITETVARNVMRSVRATNNLFKTAMLVFRPAFVARDIMECMIRQYISGGKNVISNPRQMLATIVSNPVGARTLLAKADRAALQKYDAYLVDAKGNSFHSKAYSPGLSQEFMNSSSKMMSERAVSSDARMLTHGIKPDGKWYHIVLNERKANATEYADALAGRILNHYADPVRRVIASWIASGNADALPKVMQKAIASGKITFEDAVCRMVKERRFKGLDMLANSTDEAKRILSSATGRKQFFFDHENSIKNQLSNESLGMKTLLDFIAKGKIVDDKGKEIFTLTADFARNQKQLSKIIKQQLITNDTMAERAMNLEIPAMMNGKDSPNKMKQLVDNFFEVAARSTTRVIYSPEYRVKYWERIAEIAPMMKKETAQKLLNSAFAKEIMGTKVVTVAEDGTRSVVNYADFNPAFKKITEAAEGKYTDGFLNIDEVHDMASEKAYKHVATLFYDAAERNNLTQAASIALPFVNAWQNTIRTWGQYSMSTNRLARRVMPLTRLLQTLQSPSSRAIYDITGTPTASTDPSEGFIYSDQNGNKQFTVPFSGGLVTAFGLFGDRSMANISMSLQSLNLAFSGGALPGSDVGIAPGVGPLITLGYQRMTPQSWKYAMPPVIRDIIEPYGPQKTASFLENFAPGWLKNFLFAADPGQVAKFSKGVMGWLASTDPKYAQLYDQSTTLSASDRNALQNDLADKAGHIAVGQIMWQSLVKAISPGAPIYTWYQKAKGGQSMSQVQLASAFNEIYNQVGDYNVAFGQFADTFGPQAIMSMLSTSTAEVMGTSEAYNFASSHTDLLNKYVKEIPYFFTGGDYSVHYAAMLRQRGENAAVSRGDLIREADGAMVAAMRGQLLIKAARYGYGPDWVDEQMASQKANLFPGYEPLRPKRSSDKKNRIARVIEMMNDPRIANTEAGKGLAEWLPMYKQVQQQATDLGYKSIAVDDLVAEREMLDAKADDISKTNPDFGNLYRRVFYYDVNG